MIPIRKPWRKEKISGGIEKRGGGEGVARRREENEGDFIRCIFSLDSFSKEL